MQGKWFHKQQDAENAFQGFIECMGFYTTGINLFLIGKKCINCNGSILIHKDVFEPSYTDLKFMV